MRVAGCVVSRDCGSSRYGRASFSETAYQHGTVLLYSVYPTSIQIGPRPFYDVGIGCQPLFSNQSK